MTPMWRVLLLVLALAACSRGGVPEASSSTPVILISIDTLRADRLPIYGYTGIRAPALDSFRQEAILYRNAYTHTPLTLPSHATIFTGTLPAETGVRDNVGFTLPETAQTLAELLGGNGYATGGAVSTYVLRGDTGISQGFDFWDDAVEAKGPNLTIGRIQRAGPDTIASSLRWIETQSRPFLFFLHLYEPHTPYEAPEPWKSRYGAYDAEVAWSDELVGRFLGSLREKGIYDDALIIIFSDHGEGLGDHGEDEHGIFLYREVLHVPLLVKLPKGRRGGATVETPVQLSDIFPTVLAQTGTAGPAGGSESLLSFLETESPGRAVYSETYYPRFHFGWNDLHSLIDLHHHFIEAPRSELYDLAADPRETRNVLEEKRRVYFDMQKKIEPLIRRADEPEPIDSEEAAKLAALGYLGSIVQTDPDEQLPDPKDKIGTFGEMQKAFGLVRGNRLEEGLALIESILAENPKMLDVWSLKGRALTSLGREEDAIEAAREALKISPTSAHLALAVANLSLELGRLDEAEDHAALALKMEPVQAHELLARVWIARKDYDRAEREARLALEKDDERIIPLLTLARVEKERGNLEKALVHLDEAAARLEESGNRAISNVHFLRGDVLARLGRFDEAEVELRREIELFPESVLPYKNLVILLVTQGRIPEATKLIFELAEKAPTPPTYRAIIDTLGTVGDDRGVRFWAQRALKEYPGATEFREFL